MVISGLLEFSKHLIKSGGISARGILLLPVYYVQLIAGIPFGFIQWLLFGRRIQKTVLTHDPVFILGHYRSGTTYLHKLMISNRAFGFLTNFDALMVNSSLLLGRPFQKMLQFLIRLFHIKNPFFNSDSADLSDPAEEDDFLMNKASPFSAYWGLIFPKMWRQWLNGDRLFINPPYCEAWKKEYLHTLKYATFRNKGRQLVLKNPPSTERIKFLLELFPSAKFIYINRDPVQVYYSTRSMWKRAILPYYSLQKLSDAELDEIVFDHYDYLVSQYSLQKGLIPEGNLVEVSYEELKTDPENAVKRIYAVLNLGNLSDKDLKAKIDQEKYYRNYEYSYDNETLERIRKRWGMTPSCKASDQ